MKITQEKLDEILEKHQRWISGYKDGIRANLKGTDLSGENLYKANLYKANFKEAYLRGVTLAGANLEGADFRGANLEGANFIVVNLKEADFRGANLEGVYFIGANLRGADLRGANLTGADLRGANLKGADLRGANLTGANFYKAKIEKKYLTKIVDERTICPKEGSFIAYKKVRDNIILKLEVLGDRVGGVVSRKCRTNKVKVLEAYDIKHNKLENINTFESIYDSDFKYKLNKIIEEPEYISNPLIDCSEGIHFFLTFEEVRDCRF